jgi:hypothetical protein
MSPQAVSRCALAALITKCGARTATSPPKYNNICSSPGEFDGRLGNLSGSPSMVSLGSLGQWRLLCSRMQIMIENYDRVQICSAHIQKCRKRQFGRAQNRSMEKASMDNFEKWAVLRCFQRVFCAIRDLNCLSNLSFCKGPYCF